MISLVSFSHNELNELELFERLKPVYFAIMREIVSEEQVQLSQSELAASLQSYVKRNSVLSRNKVNKFSRAFVDVNIGICYIKIRYDNLMIPPQLSSSSENQASVERIKIVQYSKSKCILLTFLPQIVKYSTYVNISLCHEDNTRSI